MHIVATNTVLWGLVLAIVISFINAKIIQVEKGQELEPSSTTTDFSASSLIDCTLICITRGTECCALSYSNQICRLDSSFQFITKDNVDSKVVKPCVSGWTLDGTSCYLASDHNRNWTEAKTYCEMQRATLAEPDTEEEVQILKGIIKSTGKTTWIGANDLAVEGEFVWSSNGIRVKLFDWYYSEPNNDTGNEDCVSIGYYTKKWRAYPCNFGLRIICERDLQLGMEIK